MKANLLVLKKLDLAIGPVAVNLIKQLAPLRQNRTDKFRSILFIRPGGIGDAVLLIPAIKAIKGKYPDAKIDILAEKRNCGVFSLCPEIRDVYLYDRPKELWRAVRNGYDVVIDTEQWHRMSAVVARLTKAPVSIGYSTNERRKLFTHQIPYSHDDYEAESFLHLIEPIAGKVVFEPDRPFLSVPSSLADLVSSHLIQLSGRKIVAIFPGGSIPEKRWGAERFHKVAMELAGKGYGIVIVGGKEDLVDGAAISEGISGTINLCGRLSLPETAAVLKEAELLITGDSGIMHVGYGLGVRTLALFGPGIVRKWAPRSSNCAVINKHLDCSPCTKFGYTPVCNKGVECMNLIGVEEVYEKAIELLKI